MTGGLILAMDDPSGWVGLAAALGLALLAGMVVRDFVRDRWRK